MSKEDLIDKLLGMLEENDETSSPYISTSSKNSPKFSFEIRQNASICFTGTLKNYNRETAFSVASSVGLSIDKHPVKSTDYLVVGDKTASYSKVTKARANGTIILSEDEFEYLLQVYTNKTF